jgi:DNA-binding transcriptional LysR family regulator
LLYVINLLVMASRSLHHWEHRVGRRLHLRDLHILLTVAQSRSMIRASQQLAMSQPAVSKAIAALEHTLGVRLLDRGPRGVEPTRYGHALLRRGAAVFDELRQGVSEIEFLADPGVGELRIGCGEPVAITLLPTVIQALSSTYPRLVFHVRQVDTIAFDFRDLRERKLDILVGRIAEPFKEDDLNAETVLEQRVALVAGAQSEWARRRKLSLGELVNEKWVLLPPEMPESEYVASAFRAQGLTPPRASVATLSFHIRAALVARGDFLSAFPMDLLSHFGSVKALSVDLGLRPRPVAIVTLKNRTLSPAAELFIDCIRDVASSRRAVGPPSRTLG